MDVALHCTLVDGGSTDLQTTAEILSVALFEQGATAVGEPEGAPVTLIAGFTSTKFASDAAAHLKATYPSFIADITLDSTSHDDWVVSQRAGLEPTTVGKWRIRAPWNPEPSDADPFYDIVIDPGAAFGHGGHPTTRLTLEMYLEVVAAADSQPQPATSSHAPTRVVDLGTGTGVLAIIAARLGSQVLAIENDPRAAEMAWLNIERNSAHPYDSVLELITLRLEDAAEIRPEADSLVVANVTLDVQRRIAPNCAHVDHLILSGLLVDQVPHIALEYPHHDLVTVRESGEWAAVELVRQHRGARSQSE